MIAGLLGFSDLAESRAWCRELCPKVVPFLYDPCFLFFRFVVAVSMERLVAIKFPLQARIYLKRRRIVSAIILVWSLSAAMTAYENLAFVRTYHYCNGTQIFVHNLPIVDKSVSMLYSSSLLYYYGISLYLSIFLIIIAPTILLLVVNSCLIVSLKRQKQYLTSAGSGSASDQKLEDERYRIRERKITITVACIVTSFVVSTLPSAVLQIWYLTAQPTEMPPIHKTLMDLSNCLVTMGKVLNFFLFCLSSEHFRQELSIFFCGKRAKGSSINVTLFWEFMTPSTSPLLQTVTSFLTPAV